jgi:hypothetical protein
MFVGATSAVARPQLATLSDATYYHFSATTASVTVDFSADGYVKFNGVNQYAWLLVGAPADYEVYVSNAGPQSLTSGTLNTWLGLGTTRSYSLQRSVNGLSESVLTVQGRTSAGEVLGSAVITLRAERESS